MPIAYHGEGAILGLAETFSGVAYQTTAVAATNITVQFLSCADVVNMTKDDSGKGLQVVSTLIAYLENLQKKIKSLAVYQPEQEAMGLLMPRADVRYRCLPFTEDFIRVAHSAPASPHPGSPHTVCW